MLSFVVELLLCLAITGNAGVAREGDDWTVWVESRNWLFWPVVFFVTFVLPLADLFVGRLK